MPGYPFQNIHQQISHQQADTKYHNDTHHQHSGGIDVPGIGIELYVLEVKSVQVYSGINDGPECSYSQHQFYAVPACYIEWYANA